MPLPAETDYSMGVVHLGDFPSDLQGTLSADIQLIIKLRKDVFIEEQKFPFHLEFEGDDHKCYHFVLKKLVNGSPHPIICSRLKFLGTDRIPFTESRDGIGGIVREADKTLLYDGVEPYIKLGRLATAKESRGQGWGAVMVQRTLEWARAHAAEINRDREQYGLTGQWRGLALIYAQQYAMPFYLKQGFTEDKELGVWYEGDVPHVAAWKRVEIGK